MTFVITRRDVFLTESSVTDCCCTELLVNYEYVHKFEAKIQKPSGVYYISYCNVLLCDSTELQESAYKYQLLGLNLLRLLAQNKLGDFHTVSLFDSFQ